MRTRRGVGRLRCESARLGVRFIGAGRVKGRAGALGRAIENGVKREEIKGSYGGGFDGA